jgi:hypothetical protein
VWSPRPKTDRVLRSSRPRNPPYPFGECLPARERPISEGFQRRPIFVQRIPSLEKGFRASTTQLDCVLKGVDQARRAPHVIAHIHQPSAFSPRSVVSPHARSVLLELHVLESLAIIPPATASLHG